MDGLNKAKLEQNVVFVCMCVASSRLCWMSDEESGFHPILVLKRLYATVGPTRKSQ
jgi:hypothetical protein